MTVGATISNKTYRVIALLQALPRHPHKITRVFKTLCHSQQPHRLMYSSRRSGKWIAICDSVRFQFCTGCVQRSDALSIPA